MSDDEASVMVTLKAVHVVLLVLCVIGGVYVAIMYSGSYNAGSGSYNAGSGSYNAVAGAGLPMVAFWAGDVVRKTPFGAIFTRKNNNLPRQAWDKRNETLKNGPFCRRFRPSHQAGLCPWRCANALSGRLALLSLA